MKGPPPKPREIREREGNPAKRPLPGKVVVGGEPTAPMKPPAHLPKDAKAWWKEAVPALQEIGVLDTIDTAALELMSTAYARAREAGRIIAKEGTTTFGSQGQTVEHPAMSTERNATALFLRYAEHYALTPVARTRLGLAQLEGHKRMREAGAVPKPTLTPVG